MMVYQKWQICTNVGLRELFPLWTLESIVRLYQFVSLSPTGRAQWRAISSYLFAFQIVPFTLNWLRIIPQSHSSPLASASLRVVNISRTYLEIRVLISLVLIPVFSNFFERFQSENSEVFHQLINEGTQWHFNPPRNPELKTWSIIHVAL